MKRTLINILLGLVFLVGLGIFIYPTVSNQWNTYQQSKQITAYEEAVSAMETADFTKEWELAKAFNDTLTENAVYEDVFGLDEITLKDSAYWKVLNATGDGVMGYLSIPKINVKLAIYHGTDEAVLQTGVGHLNGTKLPIGGESTHSVLAAHRGLPEARLFTDIDQLEMGDKFYIHVLDETLAYEVDQIQDMVDKNDAEALEAAFDIEEGADQVTLFTCTPYGINSHRLLVRGTRAAYSGEEDIEPSVPEAMLESVQDYYMIYLIMGAAVLFLAVVLLKFLLKRKRRHGRKT